MFKYKFVLATIFFLLRFGYCILAQEKELSVKTSFRVKDASRKTTVVNLAEVNALLSKMGGYDNKVFSINGQIIAQAEFTGKSDGESDIYNVIFTNIDGMRLGTYNDLSGLVYPAGDGKHFVNFHYLYQYIRFYEYTNQQPIKEYSIPGAEEVKLSEDGSKALVAATDEHSVVLYCFGIEGEQLWKREFPNTSLNHIAISPDGVYAVLAAFIIPTEEIEAKQRREKILAEAKREWEATNKKRRDQGLPEIEFKRPTTKELTGGYKKRRSETLLIFIDSLGNELGRTESSQALYKNITFSEKRTNYLVATNRSEILLFDVLSTQLLKKTKLDIATEIVSIDINEERKIAAATITHTTRDGRGRILDKGMADPRDVILWNTATGEIKSHRFDSDLKIPRRNFAVSFSKDRILVRAGEKVIVLDD